MYVLEMHWYIVYCIVLSLYWKSNCIDTSRIMIYQHIMACFNDFAIKLLYIVVKLMVHNASQRKKKLFLLKVAQNNVLTPLHIEQYIAVSWYIRGNISMGLHTVSLQLYFYKCTCSAWELWQRRMENFKIWPTKLNITIGKTQSGEMLTKCLPIV